MRVAERDEGMFNGMANLDNSSEPLAKVIAMKIDVSYLLSPSRERIKVRGHNRF